MSSLDRQSILNHLKPEQVVYLSTCEDNQPYVRPMTMMYFDDMFYFATGSADTKTRQIKSNPRVEICLPVKDEAGNGYIRALGFLEQLEADEIRQKIYQNYKFIGHYFSASSGPSFTLYRMIWQRVDYIKPGEETAVTIMW